MAKETPSQKVDSKNLTFKKDEVIEAVSGLRLEDGDILIINSKEKVITQTVANHICNNIKNFLKSNNKDVHVLMMEHGASFEVPTRAMDTLEGSAREYTIEFLDRLLYQITDGIATQKSEKGYRPFFYHNVVNALKTLVERIRNEWLKQNRILE